ncbi:GGDEF domain-containing protein [Corallococcus sp. AB045]|uniref:GGDEF domain-containing protein n=1 Tax=unclassified Corallococcus TaxID=2685029 RepID=UPI000EBA9D09|nr:MULTISPECIES: GGDEF domain-containing protein [unclassified Corallococcus]RKH82757.1 GGDEF domain-containing protein [Corallococcus sp. AB045]
MSLPSPSKPAPPPPWLWNGDEPRVATVFQPIVDLLSGEVLGHEVLSRGLGPVESPNELFNRARVEGFTYELERACWTAAVRRIATLPEAQRRGPFFFNVSPDVLSDERFGGASTLELLRQHGLSPQQLVLEITERSTFEDTEQLRMLARRYAEQGFGIALDDFGAGHSGLVTLVHSAPDFIKLDQALVRDIHLHTYRQHLVKSLVAFAQRVDAVLIAEGVETWNELAVLLRLGIRHAQGYLLARPVSSPQRPGADFAERCREAIRALHHREHEDDETVGSMIIRPPCAPVTAQAVELDRLFRRTPGEDHVVLLDGEQPHAVVTRRSFYARFGGTAASTESALPDEPREAPMVVEDATAITALARMAMRRPPESVYDPVVVTDAKGHFLGTVTMKQLIARASDLEQHAATGAHPLTDLPGSRMIERWIRAALQGSAFTVIYADLDHFEAYNDRYGFLQGDRVIRYTASVLSECLHLLPEGSNLGHVGGDDFVLVCPDAVAPEVLRTLCQRFDAEKVPLYGPEDLRRGGFTAKDAAGNTVPVTLSLAAVDHQGLSANPHPAELSAVAAALRKRVKAVSAQTHTSTFLFQPGAVK